METNQPRSNGRREALKSPYPRVSQLAGPVLSGLLFAVVIFCLYEVIERAWLGGIEMRIIHFLHIVRGVVASVGVAIVVGWGIIKKSPPLHVRSAISTEPTTRPRFTESERLAIHARWFIDMRWIAVVVALLTIFLSIQVTGFLPETVWWPLMVLIALLALVNVVYTFQLRSNRGISFLLHAQGYVDLVILVSLLHFSGGVENPLTTVMVFHVIIAGILLSRRHCYAIATVGSILFALMVWAEWSHLVGHYTLLLFPHHDHGGQVSHAAHHGLYAISTVSLQIMVLFLTAFFVTALADRMRYDERRLEEMADRAMAERQLLEQSLETTGTALRVLDTDLRTYWSNARWAAWFKDSPDGSAEQAGPLDGADAPAAQTKLDGRARVTETVLLSEPQGQHASQSNDAQRTLQVTTAPLPDSTGSIRQIVEMAQDVTEQKRTQAQMLRAGKLAAVGELVGQVAHEVNNPIAIISAKTDLLLSDHRREMSTKVAGELGKIKDLTLRVARVAQGLLSYCRQSTGVRAPVDVRVPIRKSLAMVEQTALSTGVQIEDRLPDSLPQVRANANELEQVFLNLFLNALDAMPKGGRLRISTLSTSAKTPIEDGSSAVAVVVEDTGTGIPASIRDQVFEPFFTTKKEGKGTGLGLSICSGLVRSQGGEIVLDSSEHQGTAVIVRLPIASESSPKKPDQ